MKKTQKFRETETMLSKNLLKLNSELSRLRNEYGRNKQELEHFSKQLGSLDEKSGNFSREINELNQKIADYEQKVAANKKELKNSQEEVRNLADSLVYYQSKLNSLNLENWNLKNAALNNTGSRISSLEKDKEEFLKKIKEFANKLEEADKKGQHSDSLISLSEEKNISLNSKINEMEKTITYGLGRKTFRARQCNIKVS